MPADPYTSLILKMVNRQFSDIDLINDTISQTRHSGISNSQPNWNHPPRFVASKRCEKSLEETERGGSRKERMRGKGKGGERERCRSLVIDASPDRFAC